MRILPHRFALGSGLAVRRILGQVGGAAHATRKSGISNARRLPMDDLRPSMWRQSRYEEKRQAEHHVYCEQLDSLQPVRSPVSRHLTGDQDGQLDDEDKPDWKGPNPSEMVR